MTTYDRSELIDASIDTLRHELLLEMVIVSLVILIFLWHIPSAIVPIITIPVSVLLAFIPMRLMGISSNIMSLAGIAISIGVLVDGAIVEVENAYKKLELWEHGGRKGDFHAVRLEALLEVGPSVFFSLLVIAVAFLPIFTLVDQEGRLFTPLAWTKNLAMFIAALLAVTLDPALRMLFTRMDFPTFRPRSLVVARRPGDRRPLLPGGEAPHQPRPLLALRARVPRGAALPEDDDRGGAAHRRQPPFPVYQKLGHEFMPPLNEGTILYMPTTLPGISVTEAEPAAADAGPDPEVVPRGRDGLRQGRPRRDLDRPGAVLDDGDDRRPEAARRSGGHKTAVVLRAGARVAAGARLAPHLARPPLAGTS